MTTIKIVKKENSTNTLLIFSTQGTKKGVFSFLKTFEKLDFNIIYINDTKNCCYIKGTEDFISDYDFVNYLKEQISLLNTEKLFTIGYSMGAYAAIKYASILEADAVLAFSPESEYALLLSRTLRYLRFFTNEGQVNKLNFKPTCKLYLLYGNREFIDFYSANTLLSDDRFNIKILNNHPHNTHSYITKNFGLDKFVQKLFLEDDSSLFESIKSIEKMDENLFQSFSEYIISRKSKKIVDCRKEEDLLKIIEKNSNFVLAIFEISFIYKEKKEFEKQQEFLLKALEINKRDLEIRLELANSYFECSELHKALDHLLVLKEHKFSFACGDLLYKVLLRLEKDDLAKEVLDEMSKLVLNAKQKKVLEGYIK